MIPFSFYLPFFPLSLFPFLPFFSLPFLFSCDHLSSLALSRTLWEGARHSPEGYSPEHTHTGCSMSSGDQEVRGAVRQEVKTFSKIICEIAFYSQMSLTEPFPLAKKNLGYLHRLAWIWQFLPCERQGVVFSSVFNFSLPLSWRGLG